MWHGADGMGWWMIWGGLMMVLFWAAVIWLVVWGVQATTKRDGDEERSSGSRGRRRDPLDIAKERYASGQIGRDEFERIRDDLGST